MTEDEKMLKNRFTELYMRSESHYIHTKTDFFTMAEQDTLLKMGIPCGFDGGFEGAERRLAHFGNEEDIGYPYESPICCISISPIMQKFADEFTHRDILGSVMSLGIERKSTGDILIIDNVAYLFCLRDISQHVIENLTSVRHTTVKCSICTPPKRLVLPPEPTAYIVSSERLDAIIAAIYKFGRAAAKDLFSAERVYINSHLSKSPEATPAEGDVISVRGCGRFIYEGVNKQTKKGRLCIMARVY